VAQAQVLMAQRGNLGDVPKKPTAKQIVRARAQAGDFASAIAIYQRAASVEPKNPNFSHTTSSSRNSQPLRQRQAAALDPNNANFTMH